MSSVSAFNRGEPTSEDSSCCAADASACFSRTVSGQDFRLLFQLLGLVVRDQSVDQRLEPAIHELRQLVDCIADAMIGDAVLREVVSANLLAAVARAHH